MKGNSSKKQQINPPNFKPTEQITIEILISVVNILKKESKNKIFKTPTVDYFPIFINNTVDKFFLKISENQKNFTEFKRKIQYIYKLILKNRILKKGKKISNNQGYINQLTFNSIYIIKSNLNKNNFIFNQRYLSYLILMVYLEILPLENFLLIIELFLNSIKKSIYQNNIYINDISMFENSSLNFVKSLFQALNNIPIKLINQQIHILLINELIAILESCFFSIPGYILNLSKIPIWFKLLGNKIIDYTNNNFIYEKILNFLVKIYKNKVSKFYLYKMIYQPSAINLEYFSNSLDFLSKLFKEERQEKIKNNNFIIKNGFYVYNDNPLVVSDLNKININEYSLIFSFNIFNTNNENIVLLNFLNKDKKTIFKLFLDKRTKQLKVNVGKKDDYNTEIKINENQNYFLCICPKKELIGGSIHFYIKSFAESNYNHHSINISSPNFSHMKVIELGKFDGILGEFLMINKIINEKDISHLFGIKDHYVDILCFNNSRYDFIRKINKKFNSDNEDILFFKNLKYQFHLKIITNKINPFLKHKNYINLKPCGKLSYLNNNVQLQEFSYSSSENNFLKEKGIEYLIYQLNNIMNFSANNDDLNFYLFKLLNFFYELSTTNEDMLSIIDSKLRIDTKYSTFILSLLANMNSKNRQFFLNQNIYEIIIKYYNYMKKYNTLKMMRIFLSIVLDNRIFNMNVKNFENNIDLILNYIKNFKDSQLITKEFFNKFLLYDKILESKEYNHKKYFEVLNYFLTIDEAFFITDKKNNDTTDSSKIHRKKLMKLFIHYINTVQNEMKLYKYLKFIFYNCDIMKTYIRKKGSFFEKLNIHMNTISSSHCKYCKYSQILCFLLSDEIYINSCSTKEEEKVFQYKPTGFMEYPTYNFIKSVFVQFFKMNNKLKLKFIKESNEKINNEISFFKNNIKDKDLYILIDYSNYIPRLDGIIAYFDFLYKKHLKCPDNENLIQSLKQGMELILSFFENISDLKNNIKINNDDFLLNEEKYKFVADLFYSKAINNFFRIYFKLFNEPDYDSFTKLIKNTITKIDNPFYFKFLSSIVSLHTDINQNYIIKSEILKIIITELINSIINSKITTIIIQNSVTLLILIYLIIHSQNDIQYIPEEIEKFIIAFLKYIFENNFCSSKLLFNLKISDKDQKTTFKNLSQENLSLNLSQNLSLSYGYKNKKKSKKSKKQNNNFYKFLPEITLDIIFTLNERKNYKDQDCKSLLNTYMTQKGKHSMFYSIDEHTFNNNESNDEIIQMFNNKKLFPKFSDETNVNNIIYTIFFLVYFQDKKNNLISSKDILTDDQKSFIKFLDTISEIFFNDCLLLYQNNGKKIKKLKICNNMNEYQYKINCSLMEIFSKSFKEKDFDYKKFEGILTELYKSTDISLAKQKMDLLENRINTISDRSKSNKYYNTFSSSKLVHMNKGVRKKSSNLPEYGSKNLIVSQEKNFSQKRQRTESENNNILKTTDNLKSSINKTLFKINSSDNLKIDRKSTFSLAQSDVGDTSDIFDSYLTRTESSGNNNINNNNNKIVEICSDSENSDDDNLGVDNNEINKKRLKDVQNKIFKNYSVHKSKNKENSENNSPENVISTEQKNPYPDQINLNLVEEINDEKNVDESHDFLINELNELEISSEYYRKIFGKTDLKSLKILFNPKQVLFYKFFGFTFHDYIFKNTKFKQLRNVFNVEYKNVTLEMSTPEEAKYELNYPVKLKNFTCKDYYRPFLRPALNFFNDEFFIKSHSYIKEEILNKYMYPGDQFYKIKFEKIILFGKKSEVSTECENISNKGSIYGKIIFNYNFLIFSDYSNADPRKSNDLSDEKKIFYLYSSENVDRLTNRNKNIIIYYKEIKEILLRRFYFNYIAYEIFTKDNKSYFFNFFDKKNLKKFSDNLKENVNILNEKLSKEKKNLIKLDFIDDPKNYFFKMDYQSKFLKENLSNFQYLLLINKFSTRTFNDNSQYLIFPLLYMDINKTKMRDLSKAICLNKDEKDIDYDKYYTNYDLMGYHFNNHYATMAYVLYYLMRLIPFTNMQIKLQSGHFDAPSRMFTTLNNLLEVFSVTDENRELCPEFFFSFESFWNLNYNNFGFLPINNKQINHFNTDQNCGIVEFVVTSRKILNSVDISPWINIIFGYLQKSDTRESLNKFPLYSYEQNNNLNKDLEELLDKKVPIDKIVKELKNKAGLITLGLTPIQLFKGNHPSKEIFNSKKEIESTQITSEKKKKGKEKEINPINKILIDFLNKSYQKKNKLLLNNDNNRSKVISYTKNKIKIFNLYLENEKNEKPTEILLDKDNNNNQSKIIKILPYKNLIVEIFNNFYCICRLEDKTIKLFSEKQQFSVKWTCIVTAVSLYDNNLNLSSNKSNEFHKIIIGDEEGYLSLIEINMEYISKTKTYEIISLDNSKKFKIFNSYINSILYVDRLNVIISSCTEGFISINNSYSFDLINIIELGNNFSLLDFKISDYDLLYVNSFKNDNWYLKCYTLNGINVTELESQKEIIDFYIDDSYLSVVFDDKEIQYYDGYNLKKVNKDITNPEASLDKSKNNKVKSCIYCSKICKVALVLENGMIFQDLEFNHK